jgi:hypothetical protein
MEPTLGETSLPLWSLNLAGLLIALLCLYGLFRSVRRRRQLQFAPLIKAKGAFVGLVQIEGTVRSSAPLTSYLAEIACVHYAWSVSEKWSRTVTETYTDSEGKTQTRTRTESGWTTVASGGDSMPFDLEDETGRIRIQPEGAKIDCPGVFSQTVSRFDGLYYGKGPMMSVSHSDGIRSFVEHAIPVDEPTYVCGTARERSDFAELEIGRGDLDKLFLIDKDGHAQVARGFGFQAVGLWFLAAVTLGGFAAVTQESTMWPEVPIATATLFVLTWLVGSVLVVRASLTELRNRVRQAESNLDTHLRRRHDLVPQLVACTRAFADHEGRVLDLFERGGVGAVAEAYPQLTSQPVFLRLQSELADTEDRIALARSYVVEAKSLYETCTERFPERFLAERLST